MKIGINSPGKMGATIAKSLQLAGHSVFFASMDRSMETIHRASNCGINNLFTLEKLSDECEVIICIGTNDAAMETPRNVLIRKYKGLYIDLNSLNGDEEEHQWRTIVSGLTDNYCEGAIRGYPIEGASLTDEKHRLMILSGPSAQTAAALLSGGLFDVHVSAAPAKYVNRLISTGSMSPPKEHLFQDKITPKNPKWEDEMLNLIADKFYVNGRTGSETMVYIWEQIRDGKLRDICIDLKFPEHLGFIHGINTFGKHLTMNNSLDKPRGEHPSWQEPR